MRQVFFNSLVNFIFTLYIFMNVANASPVSLNDQGQLIYTPDNNGNIIPDFSYVGYQKSEQPIPKVDTVVTISPITGDNTQHIQNAINQLSLMPLNENGFRGALLLQAGTYSVSGQLRITTSGIVLRGIGQTESDTVIIAAGTVQRTLIQIEGNLSISEQTSSQEQISDSYVPVGARSFSVSDGIKLPLVPMVETLRNGLRVAITFALNAKLLASMAIPSLLTCRLCK